MIEHIFPTPIGVYKNVKLAEEILPVAKTMLESDEFRRDAWGYKNTYTGGHKNQSPLEKYEPIILEYINSFLFEIGYITWQGAVIEMFVSDLRKGDTHPQHCHPNCDISGVFYLQIPEKSNAIRFFDPRPIKRFVQPKIVEPTIYNQGWVVYKPEVGKMLIWESHLDHEVPPTQNTEDGRITLVFNAHAKW